MRRCYIYMLSNRRYGVLYVGVTNNLSRRVFEHQKKLSDGFTKAHGITRLVYFEEYPTALEARMRERTLKRWRRAWKLKLVNDFNPDWRDLSQELAA